MIFYKSLITVSATAFLASATPSFAQMQPDALKAAYQAARNQLGILAYCADRGHIDGTAAAMQRKLVALIPAPADKSSGDAAEAAGRKGMVSVMGVDQDLTKAQGNPLAVYCKQIAELVKEMGADQADQSE